MLGFQKLVLTIQYVLILVLLIDSDISLTVTYTVSKLLPTPCTFS